MIGSRVGSPSARLLLLLSCAALPGALGLRAQTHSAAPSADAGLHHAVQLAEAGRCAQALPLIERALPRVTDKPLRLQAQMAAMRCAMAVGDDQLAAETLFLMQRENPGNPQILYWETHTFSELAMRSAQELAAKFPDSYQAQELQAEGLESQGKEEDAAAIYRSILAAHPQLPGIHYRLGQIALDQAGDSGPTDQAREEFEKELAIDPSNASAEFILGELARRKADWDTAVQHFTRASQLDVGFSEAYLALGMSLAAQGKFAQAKPPLQHYVQLEPDDPAGHYQLAIADARTGDSAGAQQQMTLQAQAAARNPSTDTTAGHPIHP